MIEINLLPVELRQAEGTPLPRLISILSGALVFTLGCVLLANYLLVDIPRTEAFTREKKKEKDILKVTEAEVGKLNEEIAKIKEKVAALRVLYSSRIRWARMLYCFSKAIPEGCVARNFRVSPEGGAPAENQGRRYRLDFQGYTTGETYTDCVKKLTDLSLSLEKEFEVGAVQAGAAPGAGGLPPVPPGYSEFTMLKFEKPVISSYPAVAQPDLNVPANERKRYPPNPKAGCDFTMNMSFSLLPPPQAQ